MTALVMAALLLRKLRRDNIWFVFMVTNQLQAAQRPIVNQQLFPFQGSPVTV
jgi:hypothetical protein